MKLSTSFDIIRYTILRVHISNTVHYTQKNHSIPYSELQFQVKHCERVWKKLQLMTNVGLNRGISAHVFVYVRDAWTIVRGGTKKCAGLCCQTNSPAYMRHIWAHIPPARPYSTTGTIIYYGPPSDFMTLPYATVTKDHMVYPSIIHVHPCYGQTH